MKISSPYFSITYTYDHAGSRISSQNGTTNTTYVTKFYNILSSGVGTSTTATTTAYTFLADTPIAITETVNTATPTIRYLHPDHLGSTNAVTDTTGIILQTLDYYPYGQTRMNTGSYTPQRQYIGQYYDTSTSLSYLNARYYDGGRGQFVSEDPVFWSEKQNLQDPQSLNSYSYAEGNPIVKSDPSGMCPICVPVALFAIGGLFDTGATYYGDVMQNRALGAQNPYAPRSSVGEYASSFVGGGASTALLSGAGRIAGGIAIGSISVAQDFVANRSPDFGRAGITAVTTAVTGGFFKGVVGASPFEKAAMSGVSQKVMTQGLRYETAQSTLQSGVNAVAQSSYQTRNITVPTPSNTSSYGWFSSVVNSLSRALSAFTKPTTR